MKHDINLWIRKDYTKLRRWLFKTGILAMSFMLLAVFFYYGIFQILEAVQNREKTISTFENLTDSTDVEKSLMQSIHKENQMWVDKAKRFAQLQGKRLPWSSIYRNLEESTPNGITLYDMNFSGANLTLTGFYDDDAEIALYIDQLQTINAFTEVSLQKLTLSPGNNRKVFNIVCRFQITAKK